MLLASTAGLFLVTLSLWERVFMFRFLRRVVHGDVEIDIDVHV